MKLTSAEELKQLIAIASLKWTLNDSPENTANLLGEIRQIQANAIRWAAWKLRECDKTHNVPGMKIEATLLELQANQLDSLPEYRPIHCTAHVDPAKPDRA